MSVDSVHGFTDYLIINSLIVEQISTTECFRGGLVYHFKHMFFKKKLLQKKTENYYLNTRIKRILTILDLSTD